MATIAFHNGSAVRRDHNIRAQTVVRKQEHIDPNGVHEIWRDETERQAYDRLFGEAVEKQNGTGGWPLSVYVVNESA